MLICSVICTLQIMICKLQITLQIMICRCFAVDYDLHPDLHFANHDLQSDLQ